MARSNCIGRGYNRSWMGNAMMDEQPEFDFWTRARSTDPDTSWEAAEAVMPKINRIQLEVLRHFRSIYPRSITDYELQQHFGSHLSTYRTRRSELTQMCLVVDSGQRKFQAGRNRILWVAALKQPDM